MDQDFRVVNLEKKSLRICRTQDECRNNIRNNVYHDVAMPRANCISYADSFITCIHPYPRQRDKDKWGETENT